MNRFSRIISLAVAAMACTAPSAMAYTPPSTIALSKTTVTEGETFNVAITAPAGYPFAAGSKFSVAIARSANWGFPDQTLGTFDLPAGAYSASFPVIIDNATVNPLPTSTVVLAYSVAGNGVDLLSASGLIDVKDNDTGSVPPVVVPPVTSPVPPSTTPTPPVDSNPPVSYDEPAFEGDARLKGKRISVKLYVPANFSGLLALTRSGKIMGTKRVDNTSSQGKTKTYWVNIGSKNAQRLYRQGGNVTARYAWYDEADKLWYVRRFYQF